jgi:hypothetical protein
VDAEAQPDGDGNRGGVDAQAFERGLVVVGRAI